MSELKVIHIKDVKGEAFRNRRIQSRVFHFERAGLQCHPSRELHSEDVRHPPESEFIENRASADQHSILGRQAEKNRRPPVEAVIARGFIHLWILILAKGREHKVCEQESKKR